MEYRLRQLAPGCVLLAVAIIASWAAPAQTSADPAAIAQSQENQSAELAAAWLGSSDARVRAWGSYLTQRDHRRELLPKLIGLAEAYPVNPRLLPNSTERDDHDTMLGVLDAILQLDGRIPLEKAATLYPEFPVQSLIFLSHGDPGADQFLLDIFREERQRTGAWLAAGNMLMNRKPTGFAAAILGAFTVDAHIRVVDKGTKTVPHGHGGSCSSGTLDPRTGWPPVGNYYTTGRDHYFPGNAGGGFLANGADPSFYVRVWGAADAEGSGDERRCDFKPDRDLVREHFLGRLTGEPQGNASVLSYVERTIIWQDDAQYLRDLRAFINEQKGLLEGLSRKLTDAGLLSPAERASARPSLEVRIYDERSDRPSSLPVVREVGSDVKMSFSIGIPPAQ